MRTKFSLIYIVIVLILIGVVFISISSLTEANSTIGNKFFFFQKQLLWLVLGLIVFYVFSKINLKKISHLSQPAFIVSVLLIAITLIPSIGNKTLGARRWLDFGTIGLQPAEFLKLTSVFFFATIFSNEKKRHLKTLLIYLLPTVILIVLQPNLSTAVLIAAITITMYYLSGAPIQSLFTLCTIAALCSLILIVVSPYRLTRLKTLIKPQENSATAYHSNQIILSLASGGWLGKGFANSDQKYKFLPKISTDSILAIIGEETGFFGLLLILALYLYLISGIFKLAQNTADIHQSLLINGVGCWITYQSLINISAIVALIPLTGMPLPFISYGGSSLITLLAAMGIIRNVEKKQAKLLYSNSDQAQNHHHHRHPPHSRNRAHPST